MPGPYALCWRRCETNHNAFVEKLNDRREPLRMRLNLRQVERLTLLNETLPRNSVLSRRYRQDLVRLELWTGRKKISRATRHEILDSSARLLKSPGCNACDRRTSMGHRTRTKAKRTLEGELVVGLHWARVIKTKEQHRWRNLKRVSR